MPWWNLVPAVEPAVCNLRPGILPPNFGIVPCNQPWQDRSPTAFAVSGALDTRYRNVYLLRYPVPERHYGHGRADPTRDSASHLRFAAVQTVGRLICTRPALDVSNRQDTETSSATKCRHTRSTVASLTTAVPANLRGRWQRSENPVTDLCATPAIC